MATEKRLIDYYVVRNKNTGFYFRGKGANRWGEYHNQASIYRIRANAENTANWLNLRGEPVEIVPIRIIENPTVDAVEVVHGRWEFSHTTTVEKYDVVKCSNCGHEAFAIAIYVKEGHYCPNCGAKMDGDGNG